VDFSVLISYVVFVLIFGGCYYISLLHIYHISTEHGYDFQAFSCYIWDLFPIDEEYLIVASTAVLKTRSIEIAGNFRLSGILKKDAILYPLVYLL
jgi:hypothetical protein